jgi:hypothetical protein
MWALAQVRARENHIVILFRLDETQWNERGSSIDRNAVLRHWAHQIDFDMENVPKGTTVGQLVQEHLADNPDAVWDFRAWLDDVLAAPRL